MVRIQPFEERRVHRRRILRVRTRLVQSPGGADDRAPFDPYHAVMATRLDHLRVERRGTEDPTDDRPVELEAVGDDQGTCCELHARRDVTNERQGVPVAASPDDSRRPETRPDLNRREHPRRPRLPPGERRCCTNRDWPARCQPTGSSPADAIRLWSADGGHPIENSQPRTTSLACPAGLRVRRPSPMMDVYRKNVVSTRP